MELFAIFYALKCFAFDLKSCNILLKVDNATALSRLEEILFLRLFPVYFNFKGFTKNYHGQGEENYSDFMVAGATLVPTVSPLNF